MASSTETTPVEAFLRTLQRSGLLDDARLAAALRSVPPAGRASADLLAEALVRRGVLTRFQASKLLGGTERGLVLGPYQVLAPVGRGGMGTVYLGRDTRNQRLVALKVLPPQKYREEERLLARFRREMEMTQKVSHPHLTRTFEAGVLQGVYFIAMEYVPGRSLRRNVAEGGPLPVGRTARIFGQVAAALAHAHGQGLIHRDLKPSNIMLTPNGHAKVLDLGLALIEGEDLPDDKTIVGGKGYVVGTMDFIAPEQVADPTAVDPRADLYSLGCSLYYVLSGQVPFPGGTSLQKIKRHLNDWPTPLPELNPTVPAALAKLVERLMAKAPQDRPAGADDVRRWLSAWVGDEPELPMDTAADNAEPREVFDLETDRPPEGSFWESVPVAAYLPGRRGRPAADAPAPGPNLNLFLIYGSVGLAAVLLVAVGLAVFLAGRH